jgi:phosphate-selective porin
VTIVRPPKIDAVSDDYCEKIIRAMRRLHRQGNHWANAKEITQAMETQSNSHVQLGLYRLASMGFLNMRDGDGKDKFEYQLRAEYQR